MPWIACQEINKLALTKSQTENQTAQPRNRAKTNACRGGNPSVSRDEESKGKLSKKTCVRVGAEYFFVTTFLVPVGRKNRNLIAELLSL